MSTHIHRNALLQLLLFGCISVLVQCQNPKPVIIESEPFVSSSPNRLVVNLNQQPTVNNVTNTTRLEPIEGELIFSTVLIRHGDRNPTSTYPTDPWGSPHYWPEGFGQLTQLGRAQEYELGTWLRRHYNNTAVLKAHYNVNDIYVRSTDIDRALMSATALLAALYAPNETSSVPTTTAADIWMADRHFMPVPIHTVPQLLDDTLLCFRPCKRYELLEAEMKRTHIEPLLGRLDSTVRYVEQHANVTVGNDLWVLHEIVDTLYIEGLRNRTPPEWTQRIWPGSAEWQKLIQSSFQLETQMPEMARMRYGRLLLEVLQRFRDKSAGTLQPDRSMWLYSGHDTTLTGLLNAMGMFHYVHAPPYASALLIELRRVAGRPHVQVLYRRGWSTNELENRNELQVLEIPQCGRLCPLERMFELFAPVMPTGSFDEECENDGSAATTSTGKKSGGKRGAGKSGADGLTGGIWFVLLAFLGCLLGIGAQ